MVVIINNGTFTWEHTQRGTDSYLKCPPDLKPETVRKKKSGDVAKSDTSTTSNHDDETGDQLLKENKLMDSTPRGEDQHLQSSTLHKYVRQGEGRGGGGYRTELLMVMLA